MQLLVHLFSLCYCTLCGVCIYATNRIASGGAPLELCWGSSPLLIFSERYASSSSSSTQMRKFLKVNRSPHDPD